MKEIPLLQKKSYRDETGRFLIEGERETLRALRQGIEIEKIFLSREVPALMHLGVMCTEKAFAKVCYRENPDGVLAIAKKPRLGDLEQALRKTEKGFFLVCVGIEKPGNLGAMLRSTDAAGAAGLIVCDPHVDLFNPNVVRASMGTLFSVPIYGLSSVEALTLLKKHSVQVVAATPHKAKIYTDIVYPPKVAVVVGKEQTGLEPLWLEGADVSALIPMQGITDSLNVASAATLFLYEIVRQHRL